jgi:hypothetical protein
MVMSNNNISSSVAVLELLNSKSTKIKIKVILQPMASRQVGLVSDPHLGPLTNFLFFFLKFF